MTKPVVKAYTCLLHSIFIGLLFIGAPVCSKDFEENKKMTIENEFETLLIRSGEDFIEGEKKFRAQGQKAIQFLDKKNFDDDIFAKPYSLMLSQWILEGPESNNNKAQQYLDTLPFFLARTPITTPSPTGVASYLSLHYKSSVTKYLATRLIKLLEVPQWQSESILVYLENEKDFDTTSFILRYISESDNLTDQTFALESLNKMNDPKLKEKILAEKSRLNLLQKELPFMIEERLNN